ncbi:RDD family protein [Actinoplanes sp. N902-109]|uniref:RDD family protein n=1 Tax=Actinoplanes sp. (strain N902-109) TaxID=649831 RepID=UPI0003294B11|nr:RDD family protein [Actinoplanes sp. N902-109]AGL15362.1 RDD domain-containing protein [Actinoplanes sp. N902-109]
MATRTGDKFDPAQLHQGGFGRRLAALLIDWALCMVLASVYADPRVTPWPPVLLLVLVNTVFIGLFGQTPGMWLARLRCISYEDGGAIGLGRALLRGVLLGLFIPALIMDAQQRGLHDRAAGSIVVRLPRADG